MDRRGFLSLSLLSAVGAMAVTADPAFASTAAPASPDPTAATQRFAFAADGSAFLLDGKPFQIRSGEMHPARIPVQHWRHRIQLAKAMGMNTVALYVMWNHVEESPGVFDFTTDRRDVVSFIQLCQQEGMWVLLRPGPYVCGEWDLGGIPPYLLANRGIALRVNSAADPHYMAAVTRYVTELAARVRPLMIGNGGPILMIQVENEYGSYGSDAGYLAELRQLWLDNGVTGPFYTEDGLSQVTGNHTVVSGGAIALSGGDASAIAAARRAFPTVPAMAGEVYPGWLTHWGDSTFQGQGNDISSTIRGCMDRGLSFNIYVIHGGTNFGFSAGANADDLSGNYQPDITSYDYSAPITEQGAPTPRYTAYRNLIAGYLPTPLPAVPAPVPTIASGGAQYTPTPYASVWDNLPAPLPASQTVDPRPMETYNQNSGFILYRRQLHGYSGGQLEIRWVHDYATVCLDQVYAGGLYRQNLPQPVASALNIATANAPLTLPPSSAVGTDPRLDVLVEGMGRTNFGHALVDRKGILESVALQDAGPLTGTLTNWQVYSLPMDDAYVASLAPTVTDPRRPGIFFRATVSLSTVGDTYLDLSNWTKGVVWVNGHNLGRYWEIGPQQRLYCPSSWLVEGDNQILVFDLHQVTPQPITLHAMLTSAAIPTSGWRVVRADSEELVAEHGAAANAIDGDPATIWHTRWSPTGASLPHELQLDLGARYNLDGVGYLPRQDGNANGRIGAYEVFVSDSTTNWGTEVATGTFADTAARKSVYLGSATGRYLRLRALSEAGGRGPWTSAAEISATGTRAAT
ncbi:beta-galactosidase [Solihabitans fulvus]|uniref:Beta-galactosidase n=1 Tax=Solihabitans fulvus TaxID=1892852 RepID=A0A5B2XEF4_9PSEU|nr:beta-galactosidase [Solihabitans fulvus]KAA2261439.1 beta-galactosidase [Solihabitans fulvus]